VKAGRGAAKLIKLARLLELGGLDQLVLLEAFFQVGSSQGFGGAVEVYLDGAFIVVLGTTQNRLDIDLAAILGGC